MKTDITIEQLWQNPNKLGKFFFRDQSWDTFEEFVKTCSLGELKTLEALQCATESLNIDLDEFEEMCHDDLCEDIAKQLGLKVTFGEDDDE